jgi:hypothetical protein
MELAQLVQTVKFTTLSLVFVNGELSVVQTKSFPRRLVFATVKQVITESMEYVQLVLVI